MVDNRSSRTGSSAALRLGLVALVSGLALTACSNSSPDSAGSSGPTVALSDNKATGTPIKVGYVSPEGGPMGQLPEPRAAAEAAVQYVNQNLGGVSGHPLQLVVCTQKEDPATARNCANQLVADGVVAVLAPVTSQGDALVPIITNAGIPYVTVSGASRSEMSADNAFVLTGGVPGAFAGAAKYSAEHYKKVALLIIDAGGVLATVKFLAEPAFQQAGVQLDVVGIPLGTPDTTPQVNAALAQHPDAVFVVGDGSLCTSVFKALSSLGSTADKMAVQTCAGPDVMASISSEVEGAKIFGTFDATSDNEDTRVFRTVLQKYSPETSMYGFAFSGYQTLLGLTRSLQGIQGDITAASVGAAMRASNNVPLPLGDGLTFTCDGKQFPMLKAVCGQGVIVETVKDGKLAGAQVVR